MGRADTCAHVVPKTWEYEIIINSTGESLRWLRRNMLGGGGASYESLLLDASKVRAGSDGLFFYPYLWGARAPKFEPRARGAFIGITHAHTRGHLVRAVLEGVAFQYVGTIKLLEDLGIRIERITMTGGEIRSELWNRIKADVLGRRILVSPSVNTAGLGAAILAAVGIGAFVSFRKAVESMVGDPRTYQPDPEAHKRYTAIYEKYEKIYDVLSESFGYLRA